MSSAIVWEVVINAMWHEKQNSNYYKDNNHNNDKSSVCVIIHSYSKARFVFFVYTLGIHINYEFLYER